MTDKWAADVIVEAGRMRGVRPAQIMRRNQKRNPSYARMGVVYVMKEAGYVLADIAETLGMSDHTSALYSLNVAKRLRDEDPEYLAFTDELLAYALSIKPKADARSSCP